MPRVRITISERVTYCREVEMTEAEFKHWDSTTCATNGSRAHSAAVEELAEKYIRRAQDWQEADSCELDDLIVVPDPVSAG